MHHAARTAAWFSCSSDPQFSAQGKMRQKPSCRHIVQAKCSVPESQSFGLYFKLLCWCFEFKVDYGDRQQYGLCCSALVWISCVFCPVVLLTVPLPAPPHYPQCSVSFLHLFFDFITNKWSMPSFHRLFFFFGWGALQMGPNNIPECILASLMALLL